MKRYIHAPTAPRGEDLAEAIEYFLDDNGIDYMYVQSLDEEDIEDEGLSDWIVAVIYGDHRDTLRAEQIVRDKFEADEVESEGVDPYDYFDAKEVRKHFAGSDNAVLRISWKWK